MEEDRLEVNAGISAETSQALPVAARIPKKRFVGRRAAQNEAGQGASSTIAGFGAVQGKSNNDQPLNLLII